MRSRVSAGFTVWTSITSKSALATEQRFTESSANDLAKSGWRRQTKTAEVFDFRRRFAKRETGPT